MSTLDESPGRRTALQLRLPNSLRDQLKNLAATSGRSLNSEIVHRLLESIGGPESIVMAGENSWVQFKLRLSTDMHKALEELASAENRSMGAQIIHMLEQVLRGEA